MNVKSKKKSMPEMSLARQEQKRTYVVKNKQKIQKNESLNLRKSFDSSVASKKLQKSKTL